MRLYALSNKQLSRERQEKWYGHAHAHTHTFSQHTHRSRPSSSNETNDVAVRLRFRRTQNRTTSGCQPVRTSSARWTATRTANTHSAIGFAQKNIRANATEKERSRKEKNKDS